MKLKFKKSGSLEFAETDRPVVFLSATADMIDDGRLTFAP